MSNMVFDIFRHFSLLNFSFQKCKKCTKLSEKIEIGQYEYKNRKFNTDKVRQKKKFKEFLTMTKKVIVNNFFAADLEYFFENSFAITLYCISIFL